MPLIDDNIIGKCCKGQILITGSISDREMYKKELVNANFLMNLLQKGNC